MYNELFKSFRKEYTKVELSRDTKYFNRRIDILIKVIPRGLSNLIKFLSERRIGMDRMHLAGQILLGLAVIYTLAIILMVFVPGEESKQMFKAVDSVVPYMASIVMGYLFGTKDTSIDKVKRSQGEK